MCHGGRTICSILRVLGLKGETCFTKYHHVLNRSRWKTLAGSKTLLNQIDYDQNEPLKIVVDTHLERRRGKNISAKGHYRDAVQSSQNYTVISSGLKWLSFMALKRFSWCKRTLALPFLTVLLPSEECNKKNNKKHKTLQDWTCQVVVQLRKWLPHRQIILTADNEFATANIAVTSQNQKIAYVSRLKLNARLFYFPFRNPMGRPRNKGLKLPKIDDILKDPNIKWETKEVRMYGGFTEKIKYYTETCLWHVMTHPPITIRFVLVKSEGICKPILLMSTDVALSATEIVETYAERWNIEVTFHEAREHLGIETQRQWSDMAITRTTPILFSLYSLAILIGNSLIQKGLISTEKTAWYVKEEVKFSDILTGIRKYILEEMYFCKESILGETEEKSNANFVSRVVDLFLHAA